MGDDPHRAPGFSVNRLVILLILMASACTSSKEASAPTPTPIELPARDPGAPPVPGSSLLPDGRYRFWPSSGQAVSRVEYRFQLQTHCGIDHLLDFDGSFWVYVGGVGAISTGLMDSGTIRLEAPDRAVYRSSAGAVIELRRLVGPKDVNLCS